MIEEKTKYAPSGLIALPLLLGLAAVAVWQILENARSYIPDPAITGGAVVVLILIVPCLLGFFLVHPNEGKVLQLFGKYVGTVRNPGLRWANPFYSKRAVSLRSHRCKTSDCGRCRGHGGARTRATSDQGCGNARRGTKGDDGIKPSCCTL